MDQNIDSSDFDQIQTSQYPVIHHPTQEISEEIFQAKGNLMKSIQTFLEKFNRYPFGVMPKELEEYMNFPSWNIPTFYNDDEELSIQHKEYLENASNAIAPVLPTKEPEYSLSMGYEHLSTTPEMKLDEVIKSSAKNLVPILKDVPMESFKVYSNPLFDDGEINSDKLDPHCFNAKSDLIESLSNQDTLIDSSPKFDFLLKEFSEELNAEITDTIVESLSPSPIPVEDSDSLMDEIDLFLATDNFLPPGIESDDYDSGGDIHFHKELLVDDSISLPENKSSNFDHHNDPSFPRFPSEPPDVEFFFDFEPDSGKLISVVKNNNDELNEDECFDPGGEIDVFANVEDDDYFPFIFVIRIFLPYLIYPEVYPLLLFARSEDTIFDPGISV
uniref:Reverse transcriptase domain-containing protein n=1 Tax=Tanacetum cinerariifolium TaxID=118510 RepID=A0A6L2M6U0_TANCI|nr:hypothetical protein [Tanacetum cinerariifolium]